MRLKLPSWLAKRLIFRKEPKIVMTCRVFRAATGKWEDGPKVKAERAPVEVHMAGMQ